MPLLADFHRHHHDLPSSFALASQANAPQSKGQRQHEQRRKIWDISPTFHCSIVGTCLTPSELRQVLAKIGEPDAKTASDHSLHGRGVRAAGQRGLAGKLLHKALDRRHETLIKRFAKLSTADEVRKLWDECYSQGEISGGYWAVLTHPATDQALLQDVFGEVHMLSHLVGSVNRLDIVRFRQMQTELDERNEKIAKQEARLQAATAERIEMLKRIEALEHRIQHLASQEPVKAAATDESASAAALMQRLETEKARSQALGVRLKDMEEKYREAECRAALLSERDHALHRELAAAEAAIGFDRSPDGAVSSSEGRRLGSSLLYVGGRPSLFDRLKNVAAERGIELTIHDGGVEDNIALLPGLLAQSDAALFPVDCVSHTAANLLKRLCRDTQKKFIPLRTASLATFIATLADGEASA